MSIRKGAAAATMFIPRRVDHMRIENLATGGRGVLEELV
jgi:hypothetical protein